MIPFGLRDFRSKRKRQNMALVFYRELIVCVPQGTFILGPWLPVGLWLVQKNYSVFEWSSPYHVCVRYLSDVWLVGLSEIEAILGFYRFIAARIVPRCWLNLEYLSLGSWKQEIRKARPCLIRLIGHWQVTPNNKYISVLWDWKLLITTAHWASPLS